MTQQLETQLREAFAQRARQVPAQACTRVREGNYKPRSSLRLPGLALGGVTALAVLAVLALSVVGLGPDTQRAFAGWTPVPTLPVRGQVAGAEAACKGDLTTIAARDGRWQTVLTDTRGPYTIVLLADAGGHANCLTGPETVPHPAIGGGEGYQSGTRFAAPAGRIDLSSYGFSRAHDEQPYMYASGRAGSGVSAVTLVLGDGTRVIASVAHGWFLAWWPGTQRTISARVTSDGHTNTLRLYDPVRLGSQQRR
jgi:hypothetical protein